MTDKPNTLQKAAPAEGRRSFLRLAAIAPAAAAAAAGAFGGAAQAATPVVAARPQDAGYRKTEHVKKYLESARF